MMDSKNQTIAIKPNQIFDIIIRRKWLIIIPLCISLTIGVFKTLRSPQIYEASTTILIQPQRVPEDYVQSIVTTDTRQRINTISQQILSRTNLEKIIQEFGLYQNSKSMYHEDKINSMRQRVSVTQNSSRRQGTEAFTVSFTGSAPKVVMDVVNKLASLFMDENLKVREMQARGTSEFLESELEKIKKKLEDREETLATYRAKYMGGLPDELETNLRTLDRLQVQYTDSLNALRDAQNSSALLKSQISTLKEAVLSGGTALQADGSIVPTSTLSPLEQQYQNEKRLLDELLLKYTNKHPEVIKLTKSIKKLEEKIKEEKEPVDNEDTETDPSENDMPDNPVLNQHIFNLKQVENGIGRIKGNIEQIKKTMLIYQKRVEDTPKREQELQSIQRDYNNIRESYNSLLARRLEAELAVNMEKKQKGEQFRIIDYARLPEKPIKPDVKKLFVFSLAAGLGLGGAIIFLLEFINPPIRSEDQIEMQLGLPVLASITSIPKSKEVTKNRIELVGFFLFFLYASVFFSMFALINLKGINNTLKLLQAYINF